MNNQLNKKDAGKIDPTLVDPHFIKKMAAVLQFGANKYRRDSWKEIDNPIERTKASIMRHLYSYLEGTTIDEESGLEHLIHAATQIMILSWHLDHMEDKK